jgi:hypothetical protein
MLYRNYGKSSENELNEVSKNLKDVDVSRMKVECKRLSFLKFLFFLGSSHGNFPIAPHRNLKENFYFSTLTKFCGENPHRK